MAICTNPNHPFSYPPREQMYRDLLRAEERVERERAGYIGGIAYALRLLGLPQPGPGAARFVLEAMLDGDADLYVSMAEREMRSYRARRASGPPTRHGGRMSTYWGFHCKTCPQDREPCNEGDQSTPYSDHWMNHGQETLRNIANLARHFKAIRLGDSTGYIEMGVMAYGSEPIYWVIEHDGHDIELHNEYGRVEPIMMPAPGTEAAGQGAERGDSEG